MINLNLVKTPCKTSQIGSLKLMSAANMRRSRFQYQSGTAISEYLIGTVGVAIALFIPIPGLNESALMFMAEAVRGFQANTTYLMSLP